jgi:hypothetical protein
MKKIIKEFFINFRQWIFYCRLIKNKKMALMEIESDLLFLREIKNAENLENEIMFAREKLKKEKTSEKPDGKKINDLSVDIALKEDARQKYFHLLIADKDINEYINLIKIVRANLFKSDGKKTYSIKFR